MGLGIVAFVFGLALSSALGLPGCPSSLAGRNVYPKIYGGKCYAFFTTKMSNKDAGATCRDHRGLLAQPKTAPINDFLAATMRNDLRTSERAWIGLSDRDEENQFVWADGTKLNWPTDFHKFEGDEGPRLGVIQHRLEDNVALDTGGTWHDYSNKKYKFPFTLQTIKKYFICEFTIFITHTTTTTTTTTTKRLTARPTSKPTTPTTVAPTTRQTTRPPTTTKTTSTITPTTTPTTTPSTAPTTTPTTTSTARPTTTQNIASTTTKATTPTCVPLSVVCPNIDCGLEGYKVDAKTGCYECGCDDQ